MTAHLHNGQLVLSDEGYRHAIRIGVRGALLAEHHAPEIHYTQDFVARWQGISKHLRSYKGEYPTEADCSAFATWVLWDATRRWRHGAAAHDFVNGMDWKAGHTGTLVQHGQKVGPDHLKPLDLVFYGNEGWRPGHVAVCVKGGNRYTAKVVSHGSEAGPFYLPANYRSDAFIWAPRRYVVRAG